MRRWFSVFVIMMCLLGGIVVPAPQTSAEEETYLTFDPVMNADQTIFIEGLAFGSEGKQVTVTLSTGEFVTVNNQLEFQDTILWTVDTPVNAYGYFQVLTIPIDESKIKRNQLSIEVMNEQGIKTGSAWTFPIDKMRVPDPERYYQYKDYPSAASLVAESNRLSTRLAAGDGASYAVDSTGRLWAWGTIAKELIPSGETIYSFATYRQPQLVNPFKNVIQVTANGIAAAILTADGAIWQWDNRGVKQITKTADAKAITISSDGNGLILKNNGTVHAWTISDSIANGKTIYKVKIAKVPGLQRIAKITSGFMSLYGNTYMALQDNGQVWAWGNMSIISSSKQPSNADRSNQSGLSSYMFEILHADKPELLEGIPPVRDFALIGGYPAFITRDNEFWSYLRTDSTFIKLPGKVIGNAAYVFPNSSYILMNNGKFYVWGEGDHALSSTATDYLQGIKILSGGNGHMLGIKEDGKVMAWGANEDGQLGVSSKEPTPKRPTAIKQFVQAVSVSASDTHVLTVNAKGIIYGWANNQSQQINGSGKDEILSPVKIPSYGQVKKVGAGTGFSLYLTNSGELFGWGDLNPIGMAMNTASPVQITLVPHKISDIDVTDRSVAVLTDTGQVYQLGGMALAGTEAYKDKNNFIRQIHGINNAIHISMSRYRGYAVKKDGSVVYWNNEVVKGNTTVKPVAGLKNIVTLSSAHANDEYLLAIDNKGELWAWGDNSAKQIDFKLKSQLKTPMNISDKPMRLTSTAQVKGMNPTYRSVTAGDHGAIVTTTDNEMLVLGIGTGVHHQEKDSLYQNVTSAEPPGSNMYWITNGYIYVYGSNNKLGQFGNGTKSQFDSPQQVITTTGTALIID